MEHLNTVLEWVSDQIYVYLILGLLVVSGLYFTFKIRFAQARLLPDALKYIRESSGRGSVSSFQALMTSTASKVGTANIAGVATAVVVGGPGAIFWMWAMAVIGMSSSIVEATLAQMYKIKDQKTGLFIGGPAYYIKNALGKKRLAVVFATLFIFCYMFAFNALQANNMSTAFENFVPNYRGTIWPWVVAIIFTVLITLVVSGGIYRISFVSSYLVPAMSILYLLIGFYIILTNITRLPEVISMIFKDAFDFKSITGGFAGSVVLLGIKRGLLSNEAGMGSAPNSAATADTSHPMKQGVMQIISVSIDTLIICSISAFTILLSKTELSKTMQGIPLMQTAVSSQIGAWGAYLIAALVVCFAFSAIIGHFGISEPNIIFIKNSPKLITSLRYICLIAVVFGCVSNPKIVWNIADITMAALAVVNLVAIAMLTPKFMLCFKDYLKQSKQGKDPVFKAEDVGLADTTWWK